MVASDVKGSASAKPISADEPSLIESDEELIDKATRPEPTGAASRSATIPPFKLQAESNPAQVNPSSVNFEVCRPTIISQLVFILDFSDLKAQIFT